MKKIILLINSLIFLGVLAGCANTQTANSSTTQPAAATGHHDYKGESGTKK